MIRYDTYLIRYFFWYTFCITNECDREERSLALAEQRSIKSRQKRIIYLSILIVITEYFQYKHESATY